MSIHERWAEAIVDGRKQVEFRKRRLADDIRTVLIYATAPSSQVIGQFTVSDMVSDTPARIWEQFGHLGVIEEEAFFAYYGSAPTAVAILVASAERFATPLTLGEFEPRPAVPQSFAYLPAAARELATAG
ncbi:MULTISPECIES: ASCH domain-containing protein [Curtobacterium]|uniref:ASCH domain-containing protein n=1 Tax=Curtobacterium TaxID=2034 RepID=UPI000AE2812E|nr:MULTISPECIES: ASCH domain-containing protein [Curtobacterium]MBT1665666.1 ASCH domain-containing protein [Curtobacterium flaccumfaciens pv. flaccumfaciens]